MKIVCIISCLPKIHSENLLYREECFSGQQTTRKVHTKVHPGLERRIFHILTSEDIDTSFPAFTLLFVQKHSRLHNKKKITQRLEDMKFIFSW